MERPSKHTTFGEASIFAYGFVMILIGVFGFGVGIPTFPGNKLICVGLTITFTGAGFGMLRLSGWLEDRRKDRGTSFSRLEQWVNKAGSIFFAAAILGLLPAWLLRDDLTLMFTVMGALFFGAPVIATALTVVTNLTNVRRARSVG